MQNILVVALTLIAGLLLRHVLRERAASTAQALNSFVIHVALPALVLVAIPRLQAVDGAWLLVATPWVTLIVSATLVTLVARRLGWSREVTGALLLVVPLGNTSFLGLPLIGAWLGDEALPLAIVYDQLGSFLALTLYGAAILARYSNAEVQGVGLVRRIATFPPFIALVTGLAMLAASARWPDVVQGALGHIGQSLVPAVMVAIGLQWRFAMEREVLGKAGFALGLKLVLGPALAWAFATSMGVDGLAADVAIVEAGMGPMITAGALASAAGLAPRLVAAIMGYGTLLSIGTTALVAQFVR